MPKINQSPTFPLDPLIQKNADFLKGKRVEFFRRFWNAIDNLQTPS
jgi:hypothetical protein